MTILFTKDFEMISKLDLQKAIGNRIREIRISKNITQAHLADLCEFEKSNMNRLESGSTNPTLFTLHLIAHNLNVSLAELVKF